MKDPELIYIDDEPWGVERFVSHQGYLCETETSDPPFACKNVATVELTSYANNPPDDPDASAHRYLCEECFEKVKNPLDLPIKDGRIAYDTPSGCSYIPLRNPFSLPDTLALRRLADAQEAAETYHEAWQDAAFYWKDKLERYEERWHSDDLKLLRLQNQVYQLEGQKNSLRFTLESAKLPDRHMKQHTIQDAARALYRKIRAIHGEAWEHLEPEMLALFNALGEER